MGLLVWLQASRVVRAVETMLDLAAPRGSRTHIESGVGAFVPGWRRLLLSLRAYVAWAAHPWGLIIARCSWPAMCG